MPGAAAARVPVCLGLAEVGGARSTKVRYRVQNWQRHGSGRPESSAAPLQTVAGRVEPLWEPPLVGDPACGTEPQSAQLGPQQRHQLAHEVGSRGSKTQRAGASARTPIRHATCLQQHGTLNGRRFGQHVPHGKTPRTQHKQPKPPSGPLGRYRQTREGGACGPSWGCAPGGSE